MFLSESKCRRRKVPRNLIVQFSGISAIFDLVSEIADFLLSSVCNIVVFSLVFFSFSGAGVCGVWMTFLWERLFVPMRGKFSTKTWPTRYFWYFPVIT